MPSAEWTFSLYIYFRETVYLQAFAIRLPHVCVNKSVTVHILVKYSHLEAWVLFRSKGKTLHRRDQLNGETRVMGDTS